MLIPSVAMLAGTLGTGSPQPGTLNSFTGEVWMNGVHAGPVSAGRTTLEAGRAIRTGDGTAELLLTPGTFLRLGNHSELTLEAPGPPEIRVRLRNGEAMVEVLDWNAPIVLAQNEVTVVIRKPGLYDFDEKRGLMAVYAGEAQVSRNGRQIVATGGFGVRMRQFHEFQARPNAGSTLYSWSSLRSEQLSSESAASAQTYPGGAGGWHGPAWYWNPWSASYTFLSASGAVTGPFGWPYYSPGYTPNYIPSHGGGDSYLYGPPVVPTPGPARTIEPGRNSATPSVPLTAPGVPQFPNNRFD